MLIDVGNIGLLLGSAMSHPSGVRPLAPNFGTPSFCFVLLLGVMGFDCQHQYCIVLYCIVYNFFKVA